MKDCFPCWSQVKISAGSPVPLFRGTVTTRDCSETSSHFNVSVRAGSVKGLSPLFSVFLRVWHGI